MNWSIKKKKQHDEALVAGCSLGPKDLHTERVQEEVIALVCCPKGLCLRIHCC